MAARYNEVARLIRFTPASASAATVKDRPLIPAMKFTGNATARRKPRARRRDRRGGPGAISTSAPAASNDCRRLMVSCRSGLPREIILGPRGEVKSNWSDRAGFGGGGDARSGEGPAETADVPRRRMHPRNRPPTNPTPAARQIAPRPPPRGNRQSPFPNRRRSADRSTPRSDGSATAPPPASTMPVAAPGARRLRRAAGGGDCLEAQGCEHACGSAIPGIGDDEAVRRRVQGTEPGGLLRLCGHYSAALR